MKRIWPPYQTLAPLVHAHAGRAAVIVGGGQSIRTALPKCPSDALYIGVNDHGARYLKDHAELGRRIDYIVACDKIEERARADVGLPGMTRDGTPWGVPVISRHPWADHRLLYMPGTCSGQAAAWVARFMGCAPVILVGMDLYRGSTYVDAPKAKSSGFLITDMEHAKRWWDVVRRYPYQYVTIDCHILIADRFGVYEPGMEAAAPIERERLIAELQISRIQLRRDTLIDQRPFHAGDVVEVSRKEAENLTKQRGAVFA